MTTTTTYNGWTNYETWNIALWLGNEEPSYRYWRSVTQECWEEAEADAVFTQQENARIALADRLRDEITEANPLAGEAAMWSDLLAAALSEVNWYEIAENWLEDVT